MEKSFAVMAQKPKQIICNIKEEVAVGVKFEFTYDIAVGIPSKNEVDITKGCYVLFRSEWRKYKNNIHTHSCIVEFSFWIEFIAKKPFNKDVLLGVGKMAHANFIDNLQRIYPKGNMLHTIIPTKINLTKLEDAIVQALHDAGWRK